MPFKDKSYNRKYQRFYQLKIKYGLTEEDYFDLLFLQDEKCAICGTTEPGYGNYIFSVDHNHKCCIGDFTCGRCIRGLLCTSCNLGLSKFKDDIEILRSAIRYLEMNGLEPEE